MRTEICLSVVVAALSTAGCSTTGPRAIGGSTPYGWVDSHELAQLIEKYNNYDPEASFRLYLHYKSVGQFDSARTVLEMAAELGSAEAQYVLGEEALENATEHGDWRRGFFWLRAAADKGLEKAAMSVTEWERLQPLGNRIGELLDYARMLQSAIETASERYYHALRGRRYDLAGKVQDFRMGVRNNLPERADRENLADQIRRLRIAVPQPVHSLACDLYNEALEQLEKAALDPDVRESGDRSEREGSGRGIQQTEKDGIGRWDIEAVVPAR